MSTASMMDSSLSAGREHHLTVRALCLAIAVMESAPKERRAESDMADWEEMLNRIAPDEASQELYRANAWQTLASLSFREGGEA